MAFRRVAMFLVVAAVAVAGCSGDEQGDSGVTVEEPIGAPAAPADDYDVTPLDPPPSVAKSARVDMEVPRAELSDAAQAVVDLATSDQVGGFLSSSIVDLEDGYGSATILVKVPAPRFEHAVSSLGDLGDVTRQEMAGRDLSPGALDAQRAVRRARQQIDALYEDLEAAGDASEEDALRSRLATTRAELRKAAGEREYVELQAAYAPIDVALAGKQPPPPPEESTVERSLGTARSISLAIVSAVIVGAGVVLPIGAVLLAIWLAWSLVIRRLRFRWEEMG